MLSLINLEKKILSNQYIRNQSGQCCLDSTIINFDYKIIVSLSNHKKKKNTSNIHGRFL